MTFESTDVQPRRQHGDRVETTERVAIELVWTSESSMHGESAYGKVSQRCGMIFQMNFS